jgi:hypothetical protein
MVASAVKSIIGLTEPSGVISPCPSIQPGLEEVDIPRRHLEGRGTEALQQDSDILFTAI